MKGGKKRNTNSDPVQPSAPAAPPPPPSDLPTAAASVEDAGDEERRKSSEDSGKREDAEEGVEEDEGDDEDSEGDEQDESAVIEVAGKAEEGERTKLADGYYEIEAVRRKRVRKGQVQYLIKWRGWSEAANTWEPVANLVQCSDIIDVFEERLKSGKSRSTRKRKRKAGVTPVQAKKKPHHHQQHQPQQQQQQRSPAAATYNVPSHVIRIADEPMPSFRLNDFSCANENGESNVNGTKSSVAISKKVNGNGERMGSIRREEEKEQNELDLKLCDLKGAIVVCSEDSDRVARTSQEVQLIGEDNLANGLRRTDGADAVHSGRCTGAKKRKSGFVKRFKKDPESCSVDDATNGVTACTSIVPISIQHPEFFEKNTSCKSKFEDSKSMCTITEIVKPISYKASISNNVQEVLVAFEAMRSDGTKVIVDNKFLKANNPLLLIDFYEKHLRYSPT